MHSCTAWPLVVALILLATPASGLKPLPQLARCARTGDLVASASQSGGRDAGGGTLALLRAGTPPLASLLLLNQGVHTCLNAAAIGLPTSLVSMAVTYAALGTLATARPAMATAVESFLAPGVALVNAWVPAFFVPALLAFRLDTPVLPIVQLAVCVVLSLAGLVINAAAIAITVAALRRPRRNPRRSDRRRARRLAGLAAKQ